MFTTRIRPKMSVKPLATTKYSAAAVRPLSRVVRKSFGSLTAGPKVVPDAMKSTHTIGQRDEQHQEGATDEPDGTGECESVHGRRTYPNLERCCKCDYRESMIARSTTAATLRSNVAERAARCTSPIAIAGQPRWLIARV